MIALALALLLPTLIGLTLTRLLWAAPLTRSPYVLLGLFLGLGLGLALSAWTFFVWLLLIGAPSHGLLIAELGVAALLGLALVYRLGRQRRARPDAPEVRTEPSTGSSAVGLLLAVFAVIGVAAAIATFVALSISRPHGGWDAWMTWNMRARFILRGSEAWQDGFSNLLPWSHPDYPFLLPALVARSWMYVGHEATFVPAAVAMLFTLATAGVAWTAIGAMRSGNQGLLGALVLLGTPFFAAHGASQYADMPLAFFVLSTFVLFCLRDRFPDQASGLMALAGLTTGFAACTKNEGLLFLGAALVARVAALVPREGWMALGKEMRAFGLGLGPGLGLLVYFKTRLAPPNDLLSSQGVTDTLARLGDITRYAELARGFRDTILQFGSNSMFSAVGLLFVYLICVGIAVPETKRAGVKTALVALGLMLGGYALVFLTAPGDMPRLLASSLDRLILQLWPGALLVYFLVACTPEEARG